MIVLATSETITLTTSTGTVIVDVTYGDRSGSTFAEGNQRTSVTGTSTIVDAPNSGNRLVKNIYIKPSVTATITLTVDGAALLAKSVEGGATIDLLNDASFTLLAISQVSGLQAALDLKAPLASPALTGVPTAPTAAADTDTTQIATTAFAKAEADAAQAFAIQRANHTGTQLAATISDFASAAISATASTYQPLDADLTGLASDYTASTKALVCNHVDAATSAGIHVGNQAHDDVAVFGAGGSQGTTLYGQLNSVAIKSEVADNAFGLRVEGATGKLRVRGYNTTTYGAILDSLDDAESSFASMTIQGAQVWVSGNNGTGMHIGTGGLATFSNGLTVSSGTTALQATTVTTLTASGAISTTDDLSLSATSGIYLGSLLTDGTWRQLRSGDDIKIQRRVAGTYVDRLILYSSGEFAVSGGLNGTTLTTTGLASITTSTSMTAPASNAVHITDGKIRCGNTSATSIETAGGVTVGAKITTVSAVPGSFADLAAVRTWLAANFT